jgi:hypothetical protein
MDTDTILQTLWDHRVDYLLIGGVNFMLRHKPVLTLDIDLWVNRAEENLIRLTAALQALGAEWGPNERNWSPIATDITWWKRQNIYCLTSRHGAIDVFFEVTGLEGQFGACKQVSVACRTPNGTPYQALSDAHMLRCQEALRPEDQKLDRIAFLQRALAKTTEPLTP